MPWRRPIRRVQTISAFTALLVAVLVSSSLTVYLATKGRDEDRRQNRRTLKLAKQNAVLVRQVAVLTKRNARLIREIQRDRVRSCKRTYGAFPQVFRPFFRPPSTRTREESRDIKKFLRQVEKFQRTCPSQTGVTKRKGQK